MDFQQLIADFAEWHSIANLVAEDNAAALDVDGIVITLVAAGDALSISADIGEPPSEGRAEFAELMLEANLQIGAFFAKEPESGAYVLVRRLQLQALDAESFDAALEELVNLAETWRRFAYYDSRAITHSPSPHARRPDVPSTTREAL